jgi:hypothetical protein
MKKVECCPECGSTNIGDRWASGRKLQYYCGEEDCYWTAEPRTPSKRRITDTKDLRVDDFSGWDYIVYDKYGHVATYSRTYNGEASAMKELERELVRGEKDANAGPYTGVLFQTPSRVTIKGKMFKSKGGVCSQVN